MFYFIGVLIGFFVAFIAFELGVIYGIKKVSDELDEQN